jgi:cyclopropane fatty-acyl-phospholipid synthase-like methyltransferase
MAMKMTDTDNDRLQAFYTQALEVFGDRDSRSVRWTSRNQQEQRFKVLTYVGNIEGKRVLDVGCGLGELYKYFLKNEIEVEYTGIDIVPEFVEAARKRFPDGHFVYQDIFEVTEKYDYVLASGALSFKVADNEYYYQQMIAKMYDVAKVAMAFNMLDRREHSDNDTYAAYYSTEVANYCGTLAERVEIVADYIPKDFTVFMYK